MSRVALNAAQFSAVIDDFVEVTIPDAVDDLQKAIALDFFASLVKATPVGNPDLWESGYAAPGYVGGSARSNWFISQNAPSSEVTKSVKDEVGKIAEGTSQILSAKKGAKIIWISNNLPYIAAIMENGHSTQAPPGTFSRIFQSLSRKWKQ